MRTVLKEIGPDVVQKMQQSILAPIPLNRKSQMLDGCCCCLSMNNVLVSQGILEQRSNCVDIILCHFPNVLEHEGQTLQDTILNIQFLHSVFVHQGWQRCERAAALRNDGNGNCCADS